MMDLNGARILVTGGTGSFGTALIDHLHNSGAKFIVYSRDELKQHDMYVSRQDRSISYVIGDVRDKGKLIQAMRGVDFVMHCLTPDTKVVTYDGAKNISDIKVGDTVLTAKGRYRPTQSTMTRQVDEDITRILPYMTNIPLDVTGEHPILVWSPPRRCSYSSRSWCNPACKKVYNCKKYYTEVKAAMKPAKDVKVGDFVAYPRLKRVVSATDIRLCKLFGYYVSQGSLSKGGRKVKVYANVRFSINNKREKDIVEIEQLCLEVFGKKPSRAGNGNATNVTICGKDIASRFVVCGVGAKNKRIPAEIMAEDEEHVRTFLTGYFNGDGCKNNGKMTTVSPTLAYQLRILFAKIGVCVGFHTYDRKTAILRGKTCNVLPHYSLEISKLANVPELELRTKKATNHSRHFVDDDYIYIQVRDIQRVKHTGCVYNLSVIDDETYVPNFIVTHNCAALKQVPTGEKWPEEVIKTNVIGTKNVVDAAEYCDVKTLVDLSTDKAVYPIGAYGMSKALAEKVALAHTGRTVITCLRYGNVLGSRGSIIPLFLGLIAQGKPITITNPNMTRFILTLEEAVKLSLKCLFDGETGELFVMRPPACRVDTIADALELHFGRILERQIIGIRPGEKVHEVLLTGAEVYRAVDEVEDGITYSRIPAQRDMDYYFSGEDYVEPEPFSSDKAEQYNAQQVLNKLKGAGLL